MSDEPRSSPQDGAGDSDRAVRVTGAVRRRGFDTITAVGVVALLGAVVAAWALVTSTQSERSEASEPERTEDAEDAGQVEDAESAEAPTTPPPPELLAAEHYVANPGPATLRKLVDAIGGMDAIVLGEAEGTFDLVRFDPLDPDRLIASVRSSYGAAENQDTNEIWRIDPDGLTRSLLAAETPHDFAHFNRDGTITMWVHDVPDESFAPRTALVLDGDRGVRTTTEAVFASRFTAVSNAVFALTGDGDYYSNSEGYEQLTVEGSNRRVLDSGARFQWIDNPIPELLIAYPNNPSDTTAVWSTATLERLPRHPLADRSYQRIAVSGDERTAVGITFDQRMEVIDLTDGDVGHILGEFGTVDPRGVDQPLTLDHDGTTAVTVDRSGTVTLWWVGDDTAIATIDADAAQPRWVSDRYGALAASAVAASADRLALHRAAGPQTPTRWTVIDTSIDSWIAQACAAADRALTAAERADLGLTSTSAACV